MFFGGSNGSVKVCDIVRFSVDGDSFSGCVEELEVYRLIGVSICVIECLNMCDF